MIARIWRGWAPLATADDYQRHYQTEVSEHLHAVSGFRGARLLRREDGREAMFTSITFFTNAMSSGVSPVTITKWRSSRRRPGKR
jgi:hypothetical protein